MTDRREQFRDLDALLAAVCDQTAGPKDLQRIESLADDAEGIDHVLDYLQLDGLLRWEHGLGADGVGSEFGEQVSDAPACPSAIGDRQSAIDSPLPLPIVVQTSPAVQMPLFSLQSPLAAGLFSYGIALLIMGVMLLSAWAYKITHYQQIAEVPAPPSSERPALVFVGRITGMADCRWSDPETEAYAGASVPQGRKYALSSGLIEITYDSGAKVILQGPCTYEVESDAGGYLSLGKLTARVETNKETRRQGDKERGSVSPTIFSLSPCLLVSPSFSVRTPTAIVTDLGTEFGVEVGDDGNTTSHVFRGSVKVQVVGNDLPSPTGRGAGGEGCVVLRENESARIETGKGGPRFVLADKSTAAPKFVRRLVEPPKVLDLLDIVAGGNGTGNRRQRGIDPVSGRDVLSPVAKSRRGDGQYWPVAWNRLIDGTFVPNGGAGPVQLNSAGNSFDGFAGTLGNTFGHIWARAADADPNTQVEDRRPWIYAIGHGERFMPGGRGLLGLHPNAGLTFDLQAVRERYPGSRPERFQATIGLADSSEVTPLLDGAVDFRVFVDGRLTLKRIGLTRRDGAVEVNVELGRGDRFLTLAATDGGDGITSDWFVLGDPVLRMTTTQEEGRPMVH